MDKYLLNFDENWMRNYLVLPGRVMGGGDVGCRSFKIVNVAF